MYIRTSLVCLIQDNFQSSSSRIYILHYVQQWVVDPIIQHGVRIEAVFASLQQGEHMVESTCSFQHTSRQVQ